MKQIKFGILGAGVIGAIAIFLPYISEGPLSMKFWDFRKVETVGAQPYIALVGFLLAAAMGGLATARKRLSRGLAIGALVGFALAILPDGVRKGLSGDGGMHTAIGGKLLFLAAAIGLVVAIVGVVKPEKA